MSADTILETRKLTKEFNGFVAVNQVDLKVRRGNGCGIGHALIDAGYRVLYMRKSELVQRLQAAR